MSVPSSNPAIHRLWETAFHGRSPKPSALELEVVGLFDQLRDRLLRYLLALGLQPQDGEEVVQETFLALFQHLKQGKSRKNLLGWIFRVAHNQGLKARMACARNYPDGDAVLALHADPSPDPEQQAACNQRQKRLLAALQALPEQDRQCIYLRAEGLRYREIAEVLGISLGSVANSLAKSLTRLNRSGEITRA